MKLPMLMLLACAAACGSGCQSTSPKYKLTIYNANIAPIQDIVVEYNGTVRGSSAVIPSKQARRQTLSTEPMPASYLVKWKDAEGKPFEQTLEPPVKMRRPFEGELYFQINGEAGARLYVYHSFRKDLPDIPWGKPANWEGQPAIPGINQDL